MRFDKSLKILNYAKNVGGFLELYTELDHSFLQGDKIYIVGGFYDNTENISYVSSFNIGSPNSYNPFKNYKTGYTITSVNYANNSFIINYPVSSTLYYPYGVLNNEFGDPTDAVNLAYNTYTGNDIDKGVYVSRTGFINGRFRRGTINNGIIGNDYHKVRLNIHENQIATAVTSDVTVNHFISKNVSISKAIINSKTDSVNPSSIKLSVVEDFTLGTLTNPFGILPVTVQPNNDTWGYSGYERIKNYSSLTITNGYIHNSRNGFIDLNEIIISNAKIGDKYPIEVGANKLTGCQLANGFLSNFTFIFGLIGNTFRFSGTTLDTFIDLKPTGATWGALPGEVVLDVDYNSVANKNWTIGAVCYVSGITPLNTLLNSSDQFLITQSTGTINDVSYTFGVQNSAQVSIIFDNLITDWVTFTATYTPADFNFLKTKVTLYGLNAIYINGNAATTKVSTFMPNAGDSYFNSVTNSIQVVEGYYNDLTYHANTSFMGTSFGESILLENAKQMYQSNVPTLKSYNYTTINRTSAPIKGDFYMSNIKKGTIHNSNLNSCYIVPLFVDDVFLHNITVTGSTKIDSTVKWDQAIYNGTLDTVINGNPAQLVVNSYFGDRKTPWKTGPVAIAPLAITTKTIEYNKIQESRSLIMYNSQSQSSSLPAFFNVPNTRLRYHVPSLQNVQLTPDDTKFMSIIDHGGMQLITIAFGIFVIIFWAENTALARNDVLFNGVLNTDVSLTTKIMDRTTANLSGTVSPYFTGVDPLTALTPDIREVDANYVYTYANYFNAPGSREQSDITINIWDNPPLVVAQPDPAYSLAFLSFLKITNTSSLVVTDNIMPGSSITVPNGVYKLSFRNYGPSIEQCIVIPAPLCYPVLSTSAPACFIEIERVVIKNYDTLNVLRSVRIVNTNYCPPIPSYATGGDEYSWDTIVPGSSIPTDFIIQGPSISQINIVKFTGGTLHKVEIDIEYWITWYSNSNQNPTNDNLPYSGFDTTGKREKRIDSYTIN